MKDFSNRWENFPSYIIGITKEIWEDRGIATLENYYAPTIVVRSPMGITRGNQAVMASTMATCHEFPDRQLLTEDVIWSDHPEQGLLSSHRIISTATHTHEGQFGAATGRRWTIRVMADCAARNDTIYDEWLIRDHGGIVRQLGFEPQDYAQRLIEQEGGVSVAAEPFTEEQDIDGGYRGCGNDNPWGARYAETLKRIMDQDFHHIHTSYDRAIIGEYAGARRTMGVEETVDFWLGLRSSFPSATFDIHHQVGMDGGMMSPRAAIRWSLQGTHDGWGRFGRPTGAKVYVMGISHAEFGPWGWRREYALFDEIAIWKQILLHSGG